MSAAVAEALAKLAAAADLAGEVAQLRAENAALAARVAALESSDRLDEVAAAAVLGLAPKTLANDRSSGLKGIPFHRSGGHIWYLRSELMAWLSSQSAGRRRAG